MEWTAPKSSTPRDSSSKSDDEGSKSDDEDVIAKIDEAINDMKQCAAEGAAFLGKTEQDVENQQDVKEQNEEKQEAQEPHSFIKPPKSQKTGKERIASKDEYKELIKGKQEEKRNSRAFLKKMRQSIVFDLRRYNKDDDESL